MSCCRIRPPPHSWQLPPALLLSELENLLQSQGSPMGGMWDVPGGLWEHEGTFLGSDHHGHVGWHREGHRALHQGARRRLVGPCWGQGCSHCRGAPMGGTPLRAPLCCTPPSRSPPLRCQPSPLPGCDFILISGCFPPSLHPSSLARSCQVRRFPL